MFFNTTLPTLRTTPPAFTGHRQRPRPTGGEALYKYSTRRHRVPPCYARLCGGAEIPNCDFVSQRLSTAKSGGYQDLPVTSLKQTTGKGTTPIPITTMVKLINLLRSKPGGRRAFGVRTVTTVIRPPPSRDGFHPPSTDQSTIELDALAPPQAAKRKLRFLVDIRNRGRARS